MINIISFVLFVSKYHFMDQFFFHIFKNVYTKIQLFYLMQLFYFIFKFVVCVGKNRLHIMFLFNRTLYYKQLIWTTWNSCEFKYLICHILPLINNFYSYVRFYLFYMYRVALTKSELMNDSNFWWSFKVIEPFNNIGYQLRIQS